MTRIICLCTIFSLFFNGLHAQPKDYSISGIPEELVRNANLVKRYEKEEFIVQAIDRAEMKVHRVITILNPSGAHELIFTKYSDRFTSFEAAEISLYDGEGKSIGKFNKKDMQARYSSDELVEDGKVYSLQIPATAYPLTAEFKYWVKYKGTLNYPTYHVQGPEESVQHSEFLVRVPTSVGFRHKAIHIESVPSISHDKNTSSFSWQFAGLPAVKDEVRASNYRDRFPAIQTAPNVFEMSGFNGDFSSWKNFGLWMNELCKGKDDLNDVKQQFFRDLVASASTNREKARIIYEYLQQNFRYVSIQLGIGGWQPFGAAITDKRKFGDCKALSNYMKSALNAVGINSHLALVNAAGNGQPIDPNFPSNRFNHMILCIPQEPDSIWLECTSSTAPFNSLGSFTENRNAMLLTEAGGVMVATPRSKFADNRMESYTVVAMKPDGAAKTHTQIRTSGEFKKYTDYLSKSDESSRLDFLVKSLEIKHPDHFTFSSDKESGSGFQLDLSLRKLHDFSSSSKFFISPRILSLAEQSLPENTARRLDYYFAFPFVKIDTTVFELAPGFDVETLPSNLNISNDMGSFYSTYTWDEERRRIITTAGFTLINNRIPPSKYIACREFISSVIKDHAEKIIIKKL